MATTEQFLSSCCGAPFGVGGEGLTHWYLCTACCQPTHELDYEPLSQAESEALLLRSEHAV